MTANTKTNNIALFGGTFDPVHNGHLMIAKDVLDTFHFSKIVFIPNKNPPHRQEPCASAIHRLTMLQLAIKDNPSFAVNTYELDHDNPSYMIDTLKYLYSVFLNLELSEIKPNILSEQNKFWLILGQDAFNGLPKWHEFEQLIELCNFITVSRNLNNQTNISDSWIKNHKITMKKLIIPPIDISATEIRRLLKHRTTALKPNTTLKKNLPIQVYNYIIDNNLYS